MAAAGEINTVKEQLDGLMESNAPALELLKENGEEAKLDIILAEQDAKAEKF